MEAAEIHSATWMTICGDRTAIQTEKGTRPGSAYADLVFAAVVRRVLRYRDAERCQHPACAPPARIGWDGQRNLGPQQPICKREVLEDIVWADDIIRCIAPPTSQDIRRSVGAEAGLLSTAFQAHGFSLTYSATKSAALLCPVGRGAKAVRKDLFQGEACVVVLHEHTGSKAFCVAPFGKIAILAIACLQGTILTLGLGAKQ